MPLSVKETINDSLRELNAQIKKYTDISCCRIDVYLTQRIVYAVGNWVKIGADDYVRSFGSWWSDAVRAEVCLRYSQVGWDCYWKGASFYIASAGTPKPKPWYKRLLWWK